MEAVSAAGAAARGAAVAGRFAYDFGAAAAFGRAIRESIMAKLRESFTSDEGLPKKKSLEGGAERRTDETASPACLVTPERIVATDFAETPAMQ